MIETLMDQIRVRDRQIEQLQRGIDLLQERIREMKHKVDTQGWLMAPIDPYAIPKGHEVVRVGWPNKGECTVSSGGSVKTWKDTVTYYQCPLLIVRPIKIPIELPLEIVPSRHWLVKELDGSVWIHERKPICNEVGWVSSCSAYRLPPWIAKQLPKKWHDLGWQESAVQQERDK